MFFGNIVYVECGQGWFDILLRLANRIETYQQAGRISEPVEAVQVKEKFGGLRVYISPYNGLVDSLVTEAHEASWSVCESCGESGELRRLGSWLLTRCDTHLQADRSRMYG